MGTLKLYGMRLAYDEIMGAAIKRQHEPPRIIGDLLNAEVSEKQARSIKYQLTIAKLPLAKDIDAFDFAGKTHLAIAIARACIRGGARGRFFNTVDLVNRLEAEIRSGRQGRLADYLTRLDFAVLDELGYLPSPRPGASCCSIWSAASTSVPRSSSPPTSPSANGRLSSAIPR